MSGYLLLLSIGPVQDFIAQARRTRDLWYGSHLLSELSRAAARAIVGAKGTLIFPALAQGDAELQPCAGPLRPDTDQPPLSVANKILAELAVGVDPAAIAAGARDAVRQHWQALAAQVQGRVEGLAAPGTEAVWQEQVASLLEIGATWCALDGTDGGYRAARHRLERALAARKNLRDFGQWTQTRSGAPKSSLDGARVSVLLEKGRDPKKSLKYRIQPTEQLDAVGLIKRAGGEPDQFVPLHNIAAAPWLNAARERCSAKLDALATACAQVQVPRVVRPDLPCAQAFGFDATVLTASRLKPLSKEMAVAGHTLDPIGFGRDHVRPVLNAMRGREPPPYLACLLADGDAMGKAIDQMRSPQEHCDFSRALSGFAVAARDVVEKEHCGLLVYAGGDDVLALLPVETAAACADTLRHSFNEVMKTACKAILDRGAPLPTLSVGIGVGHVMDGLAWLLELSRRAERMAKQPPSRDGQGRNALAMILAKRAGGERSWRSSWTHDPAALLKAGVERLRDRTLSTGKLHEVQGLLKRLPTKVADADAGDWSLLLHDEVRRILSRTHGGQSQTGFTLDKVGLNDLPGLSYEAARARLQDWIDGLLIARFLNDCGVPAPAEEPKVLSA